MSGAKGALDLERELNPEQIAAVRHGEGPQLVLAGAGSGKTRVITYRVAWLVRERGVDPHTIAAVTFTNKAAGEMRERVETLLQMFPLPTFVGTFHRYCLRLLRRYGERVGLKRDFAIVDQSDQVALIKKALAAEELAENAYPPRAMLAAISAAKNRLLDPDRYEAEAKGFFERKVARVFRRYQGMLRQVSAVDFDDMLQLAVELLRREEEIAGRIRRSVGWLMVDEFQDTNHAQLALVRHLVGSDGNLTAVGDEDQGIYSWRGADLANILAFEASFPKAVVRKLERNYRSTQTILDASGSVVAHNEGRRGKRLWTDRGAGEAITVYQAADEEDEARWIASTLVAERRRFRYAETAVLVRTNAQTRALEDELVRREIPYTLVGGVRFYERAEIKDLIAYLRVLRNPRDELSLLRILNVPARGIGKATQDQLVTYGAEQGQPLWDLLLHDALNGFAPRSVSALHAFRDLIAGLARDAEELPLPALLDRLLETTKYLDLYRGNDPENEARRENVQELLSAAQQFTEEASANARDEDLLTAFLDHVALVADVDAWEEGRGVTVMTLHAAKGLEFPLVILAGLEEGVLPHFNAGPSREDVEEERRLLYVGMTRAQKRLVLTFCRRRRIAGRYQDQQESRFLAEVPERFLDALRSPELYYERDRGPAHDRRAGGVLEFFGRGVEAGDAGGSPGVPPRPGSSYGGPARVGPAMPPPSVARTPRTLRKGSRVQHPTLGEGVVLDIEGSGDDGKITVYFQRAGKRKLVARYASLELL